MKIQINSLKALERLIGGDTDVEIELRRSIVVDFGKKYLKTVATEFAANALNSAMTDSISKQVFEEHSSWNRKPELKPKFKEDLRVKMKEILNPMIIDIMASLVDRPFLEQLIKSCVKIEVEHAIAKIKKEQIEEKARELIRGKLDSI